LGLTNLLANELEEVFNHWSKVRITDALVKRLVQMAMTPNKEVLELIRGGRQEELSTAFNNIVSSVMEYSMSSPTQQEPTTKGSLFGAYNAVTGYFQNVRNYKDDESKFKSIMYGSGLTASQTAFDLCLQYSNHGDSILN
jgi:hypothetical protein